MEEPGRVRACRARKGIEPRAEPRAVSAAASGRVCGEPQPAPSGEGVSRRSWVGRSAGLEEARRRPGPTPPGHFAPRALSVQEAAESGEPRARRLPSTVSSLEWEAQHPWRLPGAPLGCWAAGRGWQQRETEYPRAGGERRSRELAPPPLLQSKNYLLLKL